MPNFKQHVFVCTNKRDASDPRGDCCARGSEAIRDYLKDQIKQRGLAKDIRINAAGCLDACSMGPTVVIYPEGSWHTIKDLDEADAFLNKHLLNQTP